MCWKKKLYVICSLRLLCHNNRYWENIFFLNETANGLKKCSSAATRGSSMLCFWGEMAADCCNGLGTCCFLFSTLPLKNIKESEWILVVFIEIFNFNGSFLTLSVIWYIFIAQYLPSIFSVYWSICWLICCPHPSRSWTEHVEQCSRE